MSDGTFSHVTAHLNFKITVADMQKCFQGNCFGSDKSYPLFVEIENSVFCTFKVIIK